MLCNYAFKDDSDIDYDELQNLSILHEEFNTSQISQMFTRNTNLTGSLSHTSSINNNISSSSSSSSNRKRRIKAPDSLKSPLAPWCEPTENWRALVTEDILVDSISSKPDNATHTRNTPTRRHTMNMADFKSLSSLFSKKTTNLNCKQVKVSNWKLVKNSLIAAPVYMKSGPGHYDFCYVDIDELLKVRSCFARFEQVVIERIEIYSKILKNH